MTSSLLIIFVQDKSSFALPGQGLTVLLTPSHMSWDQYRAVGSEIPWEGYTAQLNSQPLY